MSKPIKRTIANIFFVIISFNALSSEPFDKVIIEVSKCTTLTEYYLTKNKFYSRSSDSKILRDIDFGFKHFYHEFSYNYSTETGSYYKDFRFYAIVKNDSIYFGRIEQLNWRGKVEKKADLKIYNSELSSYVSNHNEFYNVHLTIENLIDEMSNMRYYSFCCGDACSFIPKPAKQMKNFVESNNKKKIERWLVNPNPELQAYAIWGIKRLEKKGIKQSEFEKRILEHLLIRNSLIYNCSGCLMGLENPLKELLKHEFE